MAETRGIRVRVPESLESAARASNPELAGVDMSTLVRTALATLAGHHPVTDAMHVALSARQPRGGARPRAGAPA
jgi:antitoxin component of RelBE/YafQ-DinJ toxin-antitoxin module